MFGLRPEVRKFEASGRNENFQYLYTGSKDYPNGLGTGGHPGSWGMFLDCGLTAGEVSRKCSTFSEYVRPTSGLTFNIVHLEVWATGYPDLMPDDFGDGALPRVLEHSDVEDWSRMREIIGRLQARSSAPGDFLMAASTEE
ncbi:hypothetical protein AAG570_007337 [Ranatra chinensis]|uniref:TLDc domain-containing protein n=1 Tax=Ranatra chinensis TaxID=642074 RepID=A0ABD0XVK3_9HEMI